MQRSMKRSEKIKQSKIIVDTQKGSKSFLALCGDSTKPHENEQTAETFYKQFRPKNQTRKNAKC